jgi:hypothetical protein
MSEHCKALISTLNHLLLCFLLPLFWTATATATARNPRIHVTSDQNPHAARLSIVDWFGICTPCIAPLLAHIVAGIPPLRPRLSSSSPKWHEEFTIYNPTTIIWRYVAILDRRIRAGSAWTEADLAASNTYFWTKTGWDGSDQMVILSRAFLVISPAGTRLKLVSWTTLLTFIIVTQGAQAIALFGRDIFGRGTFMYGVAGDSIFIPVGLFGIARALAALWLTDSYLYSNRTSPSEPDIDSEEDPYTIEDDLPMLAPKTSALSLTTFQRGRLRSCGYFRPSSFWGSRLVRFFYTSCLATLCLAALSYLYRIGFTRPYAQVTGTVFLMWLLYFTLFTVSFAVFLFYLCCGSTTTTVIPCINAIWYKFYTGFLFLMTVALITTALVEWRKLPCNKYTTFPITAQLNYLVCDIPVPIVTFANNQMDGLIISSKNPSVNLGEPIRIPSLIAHSEIEIERTCNGNKSGECTERRHLPMFYENESNEPSRTFPFL